MKFGSFERYIYVNADNCPYVSWLDATSEKDDFEFWLAGRLAEFDVSRIKDRLVSVLDIGCGWGSTSFRIIRVLQNAGLRVDYTGVDLYQHQLDKFSELADEVGLTNLRLIRGGAEDFAPDRTYNLVIAAIYSTILVI